MRLSSTSVTINIVLSILMAAADFTSPAKPSTPLSDEVGRHLLGDTFQIYGAVSAIPAPVKTAMCGRRLMGPSYGAMPFPLADPGEPYQSTDVIMNPNLPNRRLIFVAVTPQYCLIAYEQGGFGYSRDAAMYRITGKRATRIWYASIYGKRQTLSDLRAAFRAKQYQTID